MRLLGEWGLGGIGDWAVTEGRPAGRGRRSPDLVTPADTNAHPWLNHRRQVGGCPTSHFPKLGS
jgi:hypothetical protein